jgi:hypothetical protein
MSVRAKTEDKVERKGKVEKTELAEEICGKTEKWFTAVWNGTNSEIRR